MRHVLGPIFVLLMFTAFANARELPPVPQAGFHHATIERVVDGDTLRVTIHAYPVEYRHIDIRIAGIDAPETIAHNAKCPQEIVLGKQATATLSSLIPVGSNVRVYPHGHDKYFRILGDVVFGNHQGVAQTMLRLGAAKPYTGEGPKPDWCSTTRRR